MNIRLKRRIFYMNSQEETRIFPFSCHIMLASPAELRKTYAQFWKEQEVFPIFVIINLLKVQWSRYVSGSLLSDLHDVRRCNDIHSWIEQNIKTWNIGEIEDILLKLLEVPRSFIIMWVSYRSYTTFWKSPLRTFLRNGPPK